MKRKIKFLFKKIDHNTSYSLFLSNEIFLIFTCIFRFSFKVPYFVNSLINKSYLIFLPPTIVPKILISLSISIKSASFPTSMLPLFLSALIAFAGVKLAILTAS